MIFPLVFSTKAPIIVPIKQKRLEIFMMIAAVIAEYNPFHNGHAYQLKEIRRQTGADLILVMMSGDFVQRGAPSCVDKYARCRMALAARCRYGL